VTGKGGKERRIPAHPIIADALRALPRGYVFPGVDAGHLSPDRVGRLMAAALPGDWTAHSLRHRFATRAFAGQRDLLTVQQLLGHASVATTQRYTQVPDDALRRAVIDAA
jgi:integrase